MAGRKRYLLILIFLIFWAVSAFIFPYYTEGRNTITIKDMAGRQVAVPEKVSRIVALSGTLRFVAYLKEIDKVVGIESAEKKEIYNAGRPFLAAMRGTAEKIPIIGEGGAGKLPDFEKLIAAAPQVIFTTGIDPAHADTIQQRTNIPVIVLNYGGVGLLETDAVADSLILMGKILKAEKRATEIKDFISKTLKDLQRRTDKIAQNKKLSVYIGAVNYRGAHGITSTQGFYPPLEWINAMNVANAIGKQGSVFIDREKLLVWDPDVIFIDTGGFSLVSDDYIKDPVYYQKLKAVKNKRIYSTLQYNNYFTNIELAFVNAYFAGKILYPDRFSDIDPVKKANEIIRFFTGHATYNEIKAQTKGFGRVAFSKEGIDVKQ